ncbi:MAG: exodeoxyribonuclease VII small subunit [Chitinophagaceae bacterium]|jgi:exodeoxyribonuclease VII small subunit|nr:exodeoxyribonuclease VII small subunit [Chitinophagaceae bacterium]
MNQEMTFDEAWQTLQQLVAEVEDESLPLDQLAEKVKAARQLVKFCEAKLRSIEQDLQQSDDEDEA